MQVGFPRLGYGSYDFWIDLESGMEMKPANIGGPPFRFFMFSLLSSFLSLGCNIFISRLTCYTGCNLQKLIGYGNQKSDKYLPLCTPFIHYHSLLLKS